MCPSTQVEGKDIPAMPKARAAGPRISSGPPQLQPSPLLWQTSEIS